MAAVAALAAWKMFEKVRSVFQTARCFASMPDPDVFAGKFFNRSRELEELNNLLSPLNIGAPGQIVLLTGPKDSGKSALLREYYTRQRSSEYKEYKGVPAFVDMRMRSNMNPSEFARNLADSFAKSLEVKSKADDVLGKWGFTISAERIGLATPWGTLDFGLKQKDLMNVVMSAFESYTSLLPKYVSSFHAGFPTIFIDEANALASWSRTPEGAANLEAVLRFLVRISKQQTGANVVLASSENFFKEWLCGRTPFSGHNVTVETLGHLSKEEARQFVTETIKESNMDREGLEEEVSAVWEDVFAHYGGSILLLQRFVKLAVRAGPGRVLEKWEPVREQHLATARVFVKSALYPSGLSQALCFERVEAPKWTTEDWRMVVKAMANAKDGVVSYEKLLRSVPATAVASLILNNFLQYWLPSTWARDIEVPKHSWPIVMPVSKAQHLAMQEMEQQHDGDGHT